MSVFCCLPRRRGTVPRHQTKPPLQSAARARPSSLGFHIGASWAISGQRLIIEPMQERQRERIVPQSLHVPGPDSSSGVSVAVHVRVKPFEGDVHVPGNAAALIYLHEDALAPVYDLEAAFGRGVVADPDVHACLASERHSRSNGGLEIPHRCHVKFTELQQPFVGGNFILRRIAQDALDSVALADEVDESGVKSVKHGDRRCANTTIRLRDISRSGT
jgi:hypothetical protein